MGIIPKIKEQKLEAEVRKITHKEELMPKVTGKRGEKVKDLHREIRILQEKLAGLRF